MSWGKRLCRLCCLGEEHDTDQHRDELHIEDKMREEILMRRYKFVGPKGEVFLLFSRHVSALQKARYENWQIYRVSTASTGKVTLYWR